MPDSWVSLVIDGLALSPTVSGLFSEQPSLVEERSRETGLRMPRGASPRTVTHFVLGQKTRPMLAGLTAGAALAAALATPVLATPFAALIGSRSGGAGALISAVKRFPGRATSAACSRRQRTLMRIGRYPRRIHQLR